MTYPVFTELHNLHWNRAPGGTPITFYIQQQGTGDISGTNEFAPVRNSFTQWEGDSASYMDYTDGGLTATEATLCLNGNPGGVNVVDWVNTWPGQGSASAAACKVFDSNNFIIEAEVVFDEDSFVWCVSTLPVPDSCDAGEYDTMTIAMQEVGHWLSLDHTNTVGNAMCPSGLCPGQRLTALGDGDRAGGRYIYTNQYPASGSIGTESQGADLAYGLVNTGSAKDYVFAWADNPVGANTIKYSFGWDVSSSTGAATSWSIPASITGVGSETQGVGVALYQINNDGGGKLDLVIAWIDNPIGANTIKYRIGWDLSTSGVPTSWSADKTVDNTNVGSESQGLGIVFRDTPDAGTNPEMFVFWVDNPSGANKIYYKVGWNINTSGDPTGSPLWSTRFDPGILPGDETQGLGVSIDNWLGTINNDIIVFWIDNPVGNNHGYYRVGQDITSTGSATWAAAQDTFPNDWRFVGTETQGAGATLLLVDTDGTLDVSSAWIDNPAGSNVGYLRTEWGGRMGTESHN